MLCSGGRKMGKSRSSAFVFAAAYLALVVGLFLALGGVAYAQTPATDQYCEENPSDPACTEETTVPEETPSSVTETRVEGVEVSSTVDAATASQAEALPNTGLSLLAVVVVGSALVAGGLVLRRREQRKS
jgi:LPXTG-motif cell wall-anchored protein